MVEPLPTFHCPRIAEIQAAVCRWFGITPMELLSERRAREIARPRQIGMYLAKRLTQRSLPEIGRHFGNRDHTTVMHAVKVVDRLRAEDSDVALAVTRIAEDVARITATRMADQFIPAELWAA